MPRGRSWQRSRRKYWAALNGRVEPPGFIDRRGEAHDSCASTLRVQHVSELPIRSLSTIGADLFPA